MRPSPTGERMIPVIRLAVSTSAPPDDAALDTAPVSRRPLVVGPLAIETRLSIDDRTPLLIQGELVPGWAAPTTQTASPVCGSWSDDAAARTPPSSRSSARSLVASRPTMCAGCATPSDVVTTIFEDEPMGRLLVRISLPRGAALWERSTHTPEPRRVPDLSRTLIATTEGPTETARVDAFTIGVLTRGTLVGTTFWWPGLSEDPPIAPTALSTPSVRIAPAAPATNVAVHIGRWRAGDSLTNPARGDNSLGCIHRRSSGSGTEPRGRS